MQQLRAGVQLHLSVLRQMPLPELIKLARQAVDGGVTQLWVTDNLNNRNPFVVLAALARETDVDLGLAVLVPYFHNPMETAGAVAAVAELMDGRELSVGMARGNPSTPGFIETPKPVAFLRETALAVRQLLAGEAVTFDRYPALASYYHLVPGAPLRLSFPAPPNIRLYCGGNGPLSLKVGGEHMDGLIFGGTFQAVGLTGKLPSLVQVFDDAAKAAGKPDLPKVAEIKLSISQDARAARQFIAHSAGSRILSMRHRGYPDEVLASVGVTSGEMDRFEAAVTRGPSREEADGLVTDSMIDAIFVAGDPAFCRDRMKQVCELARANGFQQLMFSELGPDPVEGMRLLCDEIIPSL